MDNINDILLMEEIDRFLSVYFQSSTTTWNANVGKHFHQWFLLNYHFSVDVWGMVDSQSSWGIYWFAEDKKDKSI